MKTEVLIIGAGPAGIAASIQLQRYGFAPLIMEKESVGGLLRNANLLENYPGFPSGIPGPKLIALLERQIERIGVDVTFDEVVRLDYGNEWIVETKHTLYHPSVVVIASGTKPVAFPLEIPLLARDMVLSEVWPLANVIGKQIVIVGAGDAAFDYALNLAGRSNKVTILNRGHVISCLSLLWDRARENRNITYHEHTRLQKIELTSPANRLRLMTDKHSLMADYCVFAVGREPALDFLSESVKRQERLLVESGKLYYVGDVHNGLFRQAAIAAGEGLRVAMEIYNRCL